QDGAEKLDRLVRREAECERPPEARVRVCRTIHLLDQESRGAEVLTVQAEAQVAGRTDLRGRHVVETDLAGQRGQVRIGILADCRGGTRGCRDVPRFQAGGGAACMAARTGRRRGPGRLLRRWPGRLLRWPGRLLRRVTWLLLRWPGRLLRRVTRLLLRVG